MLAEGIVVNGGEQGGRDEVTDGDVTGCRGRAEMGEELGVALQEGEGRDGLSEAVFVVVPFVEVVVALDVALYLVSQLLYAEDKFFNRAAGGGIGLASWPANCAANTPWLMQPVSMVQRFVCLSIGETLGPPPFEDEEHRNSPKNGANGSSCCTDRKQVTLCRPLR